MKGKKTKYTNVFRTTDGKLFVQVAVLKDGKKVVKRQMLPAGAKEADATRLAADLKDQLLAVPQDQLPVSAREIPTVAAFCKTWTHNKAARNRSGVIKEWTHRLETHCLPVLVAGNRDLGSLPLDAVTRMTINKWVGWAEKHVQKSGKPYAAATVMGWWGILCLVLRDAAADYGLADPTYRVAPPEVFVPRVREHRTLQRPQVEAFLAAVEVHQPLRFAELSFIAYTGCRPGEAFGLHWKDVTTEGAHPHVELKFSATQGKLEACKTDSPRELPLIPRLVKVLKAHKAAQLKGDMPQWDDGQGALVFPSETKTYRLEQSMAKPCRIASSAQGVGQKVTPQVLRRSLNTILVAEGVDLVTVREMMGHTTQAMTERYSSVPLNVKAAALIRAMG